MKHFSALASVARSPRPLAVKLLMIAVVALAAFLGFSAIPRVHDGGNTKRLEARHTCIQIVAALNGYYTEYREFPPIHSTSVEHLFPMMDHEDAIVGDPAMGLAQQNNTVFYILRDMPAGTNEDHAGNKRRVVFFDGRAARLSRFNLPYDGFFDHKLGDDPTLSNPDGCLYDPWGSQYGIIMDTNNDECIDLTKIYHDFAGADREKGKAPRKRAGVFSMGQDRTLGTKGDRIFRRGTQTSDDIISWE